MIIDIIVILKLYLIFQLITRVSVLCTHVRIETPCVLIQTHYIRLNKLYIIDESIRKIITLPYQVELARQFLTHFFHSSLSSIAVFNSFTLHSVSSMCWSAYVPLFLSPWVGCHRIVSDAISHLFLQQ